MHFPSDFESKINEVLRNITEAQNPNFKIYRFEVKMSWVVYKHGNGRKIHTITNSFEIMRFFINIFCDHSFLGPILHTLQSVWRRNGDNDDDDDDDEEEEDDKHKSNRDFYMVSYAAILHIDMHHSSLEENIVCSHKKQLCGRLTFTLH